MFTHAIVRPPAPNFAEGLTTATLGAPDYEQALVQHAAYCAALAGCGLQLTELSADPNHPDSTFVEDTAVLCRGLGILTRPGAPSRSGEVASVRQTLKQFFPSVAEIHAPGTLDGGDVLETEHHIFIGISERTNEAGAEQLAAHVARAGYTASCVDIRNIDSLLHLKSGIAYLGENRLVVTAALARHHEFAGYDLICIAEGEEYAANCVRVNDYVLIAAGHQKVAATLSDLGYRTIKLDMSEFQKMDGGLSCLSLRF